jgi:predicted O-methyltransferase YrrM
MQAGALAALPPAVARFYLGALRRARATGDQWSIDVASRPRELAALLHVARGRARVVEIGTASGWTAAALVLADPGREVWTIDVVAQPRREDFLGMLDAPARARIHLLAGRGEDPPPGGAPAAVDLLFVDGAHDEEATAGAFEAWRPRLAPGAAVAFHDFGDPAYPGVEAAVRRLALRGRARGRLFVADHPR